MLSFGNLLLHLLLLVTIVQAQAPAKNEHGSTLTVVFLILLLIFLSLTLTLAWKRLINMEGGEGYHPQKLQSRAWMMIQVVIQDVRRHCNGEGDEKSLSEGKGQEVENKEECQLRDEGSDITAL